MVVYPMPKSTATNCKVFRIVLAVEIASDLRSALVGTSSAQAIPTRQPALGATSNCASPKATTTAVSTFLAPKDNLTAYV